MLSIGMARSKADSRAKRPGGAGQRNRDLNTGRQKRYNAHQKQRSLISIFIIGLFVLSAFAAVVLYAFPGEDEESKPIYRIETFIYNPSHEAEKGGGSDFMLYLKNTGNTKDTFMLSLQNNTGGFKAEFEPEQVTLKAGKSEVVILRTTASNSGTGLKTASVAIQSRGNFELINHEPFEVQVVESQGEAVTAEDSVGMWYIGSLVNGRVFDTNRKFVYDNNSIPNDMEGGRFEIFDMDPIKNANVIEGWKIHSVGMKLGQTIVARLPPELAYETTENGSTHRLADETLIFEITLGDIY